MHDELVDELLECGPGPRDETLASEEAATRLALLERTRGERGADGCEPSVVLERQRTVTVELRSVNHRFLDVALKLPPALASFEIDIRNVLKARVARGRVYVTKRLLPVASASAM